MAIPLSPGENTVLMLDVGRHHSHQPKLRTVRDLTLCCSSPSGQHVPVPGSSPSKVDSDGDPTIDENHNDPLANFPFPSPIQKSAANPPSRANPTCSSLTISQLLAIHYQWANHRKPMANDLCPSNHDPSLDARHFPSLGVAPNFRTLTRLSSSVWTI